MSPLHSSNSQSTLNCKPSKLNLAICRKCINSRVDLLPECHCGEVRMPEQNVSVQLERPQNSLNGEYQNMQFEQYILGGGLPSNKKSFSGVDNDDRRKNRCCFHHLSQDFHTGELLNNLAWHWVQYVRRWVFFTVNFHLLGKEPLHKLGTNP